MRGEHHAAARLQDLRRADGVAQSASGRVLEFCSRRGCKGHALGGVGDIDQMMSLMNKMFETPYD